MIDKKFMRLMVEIPDIVRNAVLTDQEIEVFHDVKSGLNDTSSLSYHREISCQHASNLLITLHKKGYLKRDQKPDPTGGYYFKYKAAI